MIKKVLAFLCFLLTINHAHALFISDSKVSYILEQLDNEVKKREIYINIRQNRIDSIKSKLKKSTNDINTLNLILDIGNEYTAFNNDSAITYYNQGLIKAKNIGNDSIATIFRLKFATYLPLAGFINEAISEFESINKNNIPLNTLELYYESEKQMYSYIASFYLNYPNIHLKWKNKSIITQLELIKLLNPKSHKYKLNMGELYFNNSELAKAKTFLDEIVTELNDTNNLFARATHTIASIASKQDNNNECIYNLALSAISDIKSATLEVVSLQELGAKLLEREDIERAYRYSSIALENAVKCKATMRIIQSSEAMPVITKAHTAEISSWRKLTTLINMCIILLSIILIIALLYLKSKMKRLNQLQKELQNANTIKDMYLSQFLNLCSIYMDKLTQFRNLANRKISTGKIDDLYKMTQSGKFIEEQSKEFYDVFDDAFLNLYPRFKDNVNSLLKPECQIILNENEKLNTDLRILAFMRLGIEGNSRIAQMLNYSVNTIYAYRNKLKNRAKNRDSFEDDIMKLK